MRISLGEPPLNQRWGIGFYAFYTLKDEKLMYALNITLHRVKQVIGLRSLKTSKLALPAYVKASLLFSSSNVFIRIVGLFAQILIMKLADVNSYNQVIQAIVIQSLIAVIFTWGIESEIILQLNKYGKVASSSLKLYATGISTTVIISLFLSAFDAVPNWILLSIISGAMSGCITGFIMPVLRFFRAANYALALFSIGALCGLLMKFFLIKNSTSVIVSWTLTELCISSMTVLFAARKLGKLQMFEKGISINRNLVILNLLSLLAFWFVLQFDKLYATHFLDPAQAASYAILVTLCNALLATFVEYARSSDLQFLKVNDKSAVIKNVIRRNLIVVPCLLIIFEVVLLEFGRVIIPESYAQFLSKSPLVILGIEFWLLGVALSNIRKFYYKDLTKLSLPILVATIFGFFFISFITILDKTSWYIYFFMLISLSYFVTSVLLSKVPFGQIFQYATKRELLMVFLQQAVLIGFFVSSI